MLSHPYEHELVLAERTRRFEQQVVHRVPRDGSRVRRWWFARGTAAVARKVASVRHLVPRSASPDGQPATADQRDVA